MAGGEAPRKTAGAAKSWMRVKLPPKVGCPHGLKRLIF
jgi:hypothetical protein